MCQPSERCLNPLCPALNAFLKGLGKQVSRVFTCVRSAVNDCEDLMQETLIAVLKVLADDRREPVEDVAAYACTAACRQRANHRRKQGRGINRLLVPCACDLGCDDFSQEAVDRIDLLEFGLPLLRDDLREVVLATLDGLTVTQIARKFGYTRREVQEMTADAAWFLRRLTGD